MSNNFIEDAISDDALATVRSLHAAETDNFVELTRLARLDIKRHFRFANLRGVCLDNSDLRGFDFTGADLQGATGWNVVWDETTILKGANVSGSVFAYRIAKQEFFSKHPQWHKLYLRKRGEHWASNVNWFAEQLSLPGRDQAYLVEVAKAICDTTEDKVLRSQLLLALAPIFQSSTHHRDFLINNMARHDHDDVAVRASIQVMAALYGADSIVLQILQRELFHSNQTIREVAIRGLMASRHFMQFIPLIASEIHGFPSNIRRMFVHRSAVCFHAVYLKAVLEPSGQFAIDFAEPINSDKIERIARARLVEEGQKRLAGRRSETGEPLQPKISERQVQERAAEYDGYLRRLQKAGVPFVFVQNLPKQRVKQAGEIVGS